MAVCPKCGHRGGDVASPCPNDDHYLVPESAISPQKNDKNLGRLIGGKYIVTSLISEGGMGAVYRAIQTLVDREVALKVLKAELESSAEGAERFLREARAVSRLSHPNIITLFDFGVDAGQPFMAMEYAPGVSLGKWLESTTLSLDRIIHVITQTASALAEAHNQGIVHRDLKPENIIVIRSGNDPDFVKLLDFGIARLVNATATRGLTREGEVYGTPHYMAPEQAKGEANIGPPADVYSIGIMLYQLLCAKMPFDAPTPLAVLYQHLHEPLPAIAARPGVVVSPELERIIRTATQKSVQDRYQTASELLGALQNLKNPTRASALAEELFADFGGTIPGATPLASTQNHPALQSSAIPVHDPDPSIELPPEPHVEEGVSKALIGLVAALMLAVIGGVAYLALDTFSGQATTEPVDMVQNPPVEKKTPPQPEKTEPEKVAEVPKVEPVAVQEPEKVEPEKVEPENVEPEKVEPEKAEPEKTAELAKPEPKTKVAASTKTKVKKVAEPKVEKTEPAKVEEPVEAEKKVEPMKFKPVGDPRKWN